MRHVRVSQSGCWLWTAYRMKNGYGQFTVAAQDRRLAHRAAWWLHFGDVPEGMFVLHRCDNRACVNPKHLFLGTHADNMRDMLSKGREARGEKARHAKLLEADVRRIRASVGPRDSIASLYGVSGSLIGYIRRRDTWKHVR
jgi:hypothetical protein